MPTRRAFLAGLAAFAAASSLPRLSFAAAPGDRRLVVVILRGGLDGLAAVVPWDDPDYASRGSLALPGPNEANGVIDLDGFFGLHPSLEPLMPLWARGELLPLQAVSTPYGGRSHFEAQNLLETGMERPFATDEGWLARALAALDGAPAAVAVGKEVPVILRGAPDVVSASPGHTALDDTRWMDTVAALYAHDPLLGPALSRGRQAREMVHEAVGDTHRTKGRQAATAEVGRLAGALLAEPDGPKVAVLDAGGWDTHQNEGTVRGTLANHLAGLADGLVALSEAAGDAWAKTAVIVVTEFGRTVHVNGTAGSDHGTASMALLCGGAVRGGRVLAKWPGLATAHLRDGRDLAATTDMRGLFAGVLRDHLGVSEAMLSDRVFPATRPVVPLEGLIRAAT